jgi:prepilin-type processing-associated H-X9-DG protein
LNIYVCEGDSSVFLTSSEQPRSFAFKSGTTAHEAAYTLARAGILIDGLFWLTPDDPQNTDREMPKTVLRPNSTEPNPIFARLPLSVEIVANLPPDSPPTSTPLAWTRGLGADGTWSPDSPLHGKGGHIVYLDSHVEWVEKFSSVKYGTSIPTTNIREALPPGAVILSAEPKSPALFLP